MSSITTDDLARLVDDEDEAPFLLDVRAPDAFERWKIEGKAHFPTLNVPYWTAITEDRPFRDRMSATEAMNTLAGTGGTWFEPALLRALQAWKAGG